MSRARFLVRRVAFAFVSALLVVTAVFLLFRVHSILDLLLGKPTSLTPAGLVDSYVTWMSDLGGLRGTTMITTDESTVSALVDATATTLTYVVPAVALSLGLGLGIGVVAALDHQGPLDRLGTIGSYVCFGIPGFFIGSFLIAFGAEQFGLFITRKYGPNPQPLAGIPMVDEALLLEIVLPALTLASTLLAAQVRYARAGTLEHVGASFIRFVRAKGAARLRVARHLVRNASVLLVSLFFAETLAVLVMEIYAIEIVFGVNGLGTLSYSAFQHTQTELVVGTVLVFAFVGIGGNLVQDVAYAYLDPRIDAD